MRFWDSSALVPLVIEERTARACRQLIRTDRVVAVWLLTRTELVSAVHRRFRADELRPTEVRAALRRIDDLAATWTEVDALAPVRSCAERLLAVHPLSAADALQLGAAVALAGVEVKGYPFVTADERLATAAEAEGFGVIVPR